MALIDNLLAYWKLDDDYLDASGNGETLTPHAAPVFAAGIINNGSDLESSASQYLSRAAGSLYPSLPFSVNMWVKAESLNDYQRPIHKASSPAGHSRYSFYQNPDFKIHAIVHNAAGAGIFVSSTSTISTGTWYMLTLVANGTDLRIYFNGSLEGTPAALINLQHTAEQELDIGQASPTLGTFWDGMVDEIGIWDRTLSPAEITELWNGGAGLAYPFVPVGTNMQVNISDVLKDISEIKINIGGVLKDVTEAKINIGDVLKDIF